MFACQSDNVPVLNAVIQTVAGVHFNPTVLICNLLKMNQFNSLMDEKQVLDYYVNSSQAGSRVN